MRAVVLVGAMLAVVLGLPLGLYAFLTSDQRRTTRDIEACAIARGWRFSRRRWHGNPAAFRIDGKTGKGVPWILTSGNASDISNRGWSVELTLRFPTLGGKSDLASELRESLAQRILECPRDVIKPHSVVASRHASACGIEARMPDSPNAPTVSWLVALGEDLIARLPPHS